MNLSEAMLAADLQSAHYDALILTHDNLLFKRQEECDVSSVTRSGAAAGWLGHRPKANAKIIRHQIDFLQFSSVLPALQGIVTFGWQTNLHHVFLVRC